MYPVLLCTLLLLEVVPFSIAFAPIVATRSRVASLHMTDEKKAEEAVFVPLEEALEAVEAEKEDDEVFEKVESLGRGSAKVSSHNHQMKNILMNSTDPVYRRN